MGYLVLARKWRPQTFDDVVGQDHIVRTLKNTISSERIAHAYIFGGQRGVGKTSVARIFAKALNCVEGPTENPCNVCVHCREIADGISIDCREIDGASNRGIDEIRELKENIKFAPISSRYKINIIDEVHMLSREAFNALLKTLEEPPAHVIFIFATTEIRKVPATIMSRCQYYDFRRVSIAQLAANLEKIAAAEGISVSLSGLRLIAEAGDGSLRDAQSVFDQVIAYAGREIDDAQIAGLLGVRDKQFLFRLSDAILAREAGTCFAIVEEAYYAGIDLPYFYQLLLRHFRKMLLVKVLPDGAESTELAADERGEYRKRASGVTLESLQRYIDILLLEEENIARGTHPRLILEMMLLRMALLEPLVPLASLLSRLNGIEKGLKQSGGFVDESTKGFRVHPVPGALMPDLPPATTLDLPLTNAMGQTSAETKTSAADVWQRFLKMLEARNQSYARWLRSGHFVGYADGEICITVPDNPMVQEKMTEILANSDFSALAKEFFGMPLRSSVIARSDSEEPEAMMRESTDNMVSEKERLALQESPIKRQIVAAYPDASVGEIKRRRPS